MQDQVRARLAELQDRQKVAVSMLANYPEFKEWLLHRV